MKRKRHRRRHQFDTARRKEYRFERTLTRSSVDREKGIIKGVSVITSGVSAVGHDLEVDNKTLMQMLECAERKGRIPTKWNHKTGADAVNGYLHNFRIEGENLRADWKLLKSHPQYEHAMELATEMPDGVGLSASFTGEPEKKNGKNFARCDNLISTDLVANPAANPTGLFEERVDRAFSDMANEQLPNSTDPNAALLGAIEKLNSRFDQIEGRLDEMGEFYEQLREGLESDEDYDDDELEDDEFEGEDDGEFEGEDEAGFEGEGEGAYADASPVGAELAALRRQVHQLSAGLENERLMEIRAAEEHAFSVIEAKTQALAQEVVDLRTQNAILHEFMQKAKANGAVALSNSGDAIRELSGNATDFERRVFELSEGGMKRTDAIRKAMNEGNLYANHLASKAVVTTL